MLYSVSRHTDRGWFRFGSSGYGLSWTLMSNPMLFSERMGITRYVHVGRWRIALLRPSAC